MIQAAILGMGRWGQNLHQSVLNSKQIRISHVCTRSPAKVVEYCEQNNLTLVDRYDELLANPEIDAVIIATPHSQHSGQILQAADAGKHVFVEKPFTLSAADARQCLDRMADKNLKVGIGHNRRFAPNTQALKQLLDNQTLGELIYIDGMFSAQMAGSKGQWRDSRQESPAGGMTSLGIHIVDMFRFLCGEMSIISATSSRLQTTCDFDDATVVKLGFKQGFSGILTTLTAAPMQWSVRLYGTMGRAELHEQNKLVIVNDGEEEQIIQYDGYEYPVLKTIGACLEDFAESIAVDRPFSIPPDQILHCTQVLEAIVNSSQSSARPVNIY